MDEIYFVKRDVCPVCGSDCRQTLYACDYLEDIPNDFLMTKLYDQWIAPEKVFGEDDHLLSYADYAQEVMMSIAWLNRAPGSLKFFDFGMGWGRWARIARSFGCDACGIESSASRIEYARSQGITVIAVPNGGGFKRRLKVADWTAPKLSKNSLNAAAPLEHLNCFNYGALMRMASLAGLAPVEQPWPILLKYSLGAEAIKGLLKNALRVYFKGMYLKRLYFFFRLKA